MKRNSWVVMKKEFQIFEIQTFIQNKIIKIFTMFLIWVKIQLQSTPD